MLIDWFTVVAQVINFLILVWLLKRFLYKPVLRAIAERKEKIAAQLNTADEKKKEAEKQRAEYEQLHQALLAKKETLINEAVDAAEKERKQRLEDLRKEYGQQRENLHASLIQDEQRILERISRQTEIELFAAAKKMLSDLADDSLLDRIITVFLRRVEELEEGQKRTWREALQGDAGTEVSVRTSIPLSEGQKDRINQSLRKILQISNPVYEVRPEGITGIELVSGGFKIAWSAADYLSSLQHQVASTWQAEKETA